MTQRTGEVLVCPLHRHQEDGGPCHRCPDYAGPRTPEARSMGGSWGEIDPYRRPRPSDAVPGSGAWRVEGPSLGPWRAVGPEQCEREEAERDAEHGSMRGSPGREHQRPSEGTDDDVTIASRALRKHSPRGLKWDLDHIETVARVLREQRTEPARNDGTRPPAPIANDELRMCWCFRCLDAPEHGLNNPTARTMILCPACGNKRCPRATDHRFACTDSNEPGQFGSNYGEPCRESAEPAVPEGLRDRLAAEVDIAEHHADVATRGGDHNYAIKFTGIARRLKRALASLSESAPQVRCVASESESTAPEPAPYRHPCVVCGALAGLRCSPSCSAYEAPEEFPGPGRTDP